MTPSATPSTPPTSGPTDTPTPTPTSVPDGGTTDVQDHLAHIASTLDLVFVVCLVVGCVVLAAVGLYLVAYMRRNRT